MNAPDIIMYGHKTLLESIEGLTDREWNTVGATSTWTAKDVMSHLTGFEQMLADVLATFVESADTATLQKYSPATYESWNTGLVSTRKDMSPDEVLAEYTLLHTRVTELAAKLPPEQWRTVGTIPWYGVQYSLDDFVVYTNYAHKREHASMLTMFRRLLKEGKFENEAQTKLNLE